MAMDSIHVSALIPASPRAVYDAWMSSDLHGKMTGSEAAIDPQVGGKHSAWSNYISGETLEIDPGKRVVQSWLAQDFPEGSAHSKLAVRFEREGESTRLHIDHTDLPEGHGARFEQGWREYYFTPMMSFFGTDPKAEASALKNAAAPKKAAPKKAAPKKAAPKKAAPKKAAPKKAAPKKAAPKKAAPKKAAPKKAAPKKKAAPAAG